jgi:hypothetical protein
MKPAVLIGLLVLAVPAVVAPVGTPAQVGQRGEIFYVPPAKGAPGRRVPGASRGSNFAAASAVTIELLAPDGHAGETVSPAPILYYFVSGPIHLPVQFTISAPHRAAPVLENDIPPPRAPGIYALPLTDFRSRLEEGTVYTWSISVIADPRERSNDIVASASLLRVAPDPALESAIRAAPAQRRAALLAHAGLWYDAVAAAADIKDQDGHATLDALLDQVGLTEPLRYDRQNAPVTR